MIIANIILVTLGIILFVLLFIPSKKEERLRSDNTFSPHESISRSIDYENTFNLTILYDEKIYSKNMMADISLSLNELIQKSKHNESHHQKAEQTSELAPKPKEEKIDEEKIINVTHIKL